MQHSTQGVSISLVKKVSAFALAGVMAVSLCPGFGAGTAYADPTAAEKQAEAEEALANLNAMQETLDRLSAEYGEALAAQEEAEQNRDAAEARLKEINEQIKNLQSRLGDRAREMYRNGSSTFVEMLLGAASFEEFATSWDVLNKVNENDADMVKERKELAEEAEEQANIYNEQARIAAQKSQEAAEAEAQAESTVAEMQAIYDALSAEAARLLEEERAAQAAAEAAARAAEEAQKKNDEPGGGGGGDVIEPDDGTVVGRAQACIGKPYVWGGVGPGGYDCSGLVSYCLSGSHTRLGTTYTFMKWPRVSDPQPGDVCVNSGHTGIYIGGGQMIHAATYGVGVIIGPVQSGMIYVRQP